jgi:hypothetical protein
MIYLMEVSQNYNLLCLQVSDLIIFKMLMLTILIKVLVNMFKQRN